MPRACPFAASAPAPGAAVGAGGLGTEASGSRGPPPSLSPRCRPPSRLSASVSCCTQPPTVHLPRPSAIPSALTAHGLGCCPGCGDAYGSKPHSGPSPGSRRPLVTSFWSRSVINRRNFLNCSKQIKSQGGNTLLKHQIVFSLRYPIYLFLAIPPFTTSFRESFSTGPYNEPKRQY